MSKAEKALEEVLIRIYGPNVTAAQVIAYLKECNAIKDHDIRKAAVLYEITDRIAKGEKKVAVYTDVRERWGVSRSIVFQWLAAL